MKTSFLSPPLSLYLDVLRILAIVLVVVSHAQALFGITTPLGNLRVGNEVFIFMIVASGFLNQYQSQYMERDRRTYVVEKGSRILSASIACVLFSFLCDMIGKNTNPGFYGVLEGANLFVPYSPLSVVSYMTFTNDVWFRQVTMGTLTSYWAITYIVMFYIYHGMTGFTDKTKSILLVVWVVLVGPVIALYLVMWLLGSATYDFIQRFKGRLSLGVNLFLFAFTLAALIVAVVYAGGYAHSPRILTAAPDVNIMTYFYQAAIALIIALNLIAFDGIFAADLPEDDEITLTGVAAAIRWLGTGTLCVFLVYPSMLSAVRAIFASTIDRTVLMVTAIAATIVVGYLIAELAYRSRDAFRGFIRGTLR